MTNVEKLLLRCLDNTFIMSRINLVTFILCPVNYPASDLDQVTFMLCSALIIWITLILYQINYLDDTYIMCIVNYRHDTYAYLYEVGVKVFFTVINCDV